MSDPVFGTFEQAPTGAKLQCTVCGRTGWPVGDHPRGWTQACKRGHLPCPRCGKYLAVLLNGQARKHARCPS